MPSVEKSSKSLDAQLCSTLLGMVLCSKCIKSWNIICFIILHKVNPWILIKIVNVESHRMYDNRDTEGQMFHS